MKIAAGLASHTAAAALLMRTGAIHAVSVLELRQTVITPSLLDIRIDVMDLREHRPELADEFFRLGDKLDRSEAMRRSATVD